MKRFYLLFLVIITSVQLIHAEDCSSERYIKPIFTKVKRTANIFFAQKKQSNGIPINLVYDIYEPEGDTISERPIMLLIHGGAYLKLLDQRSPDIVLLCQYFAKLGYVAVSINYRQEANPLALLSEETMVKAVARGLIDTKDAVDHLVTTYQNGNPYRIDTSRAFIGGVSAGAVSTLFITYLDSLSLMPPNYQQWVIEAVGNEGNPDSVLRHRFDLVRPKAAISISGALSDPTWVANNGIDLFLNHGSADEIVPYSIGKPFGITTLPLLYGGKALYPVAQEKGVRVEFEDWIGKGHVPFMNLDYRLLLLDLIDEKMLDSTQRHIAAFCYERLKCNRIISGIKQNKIDELNIYPNPSKGATTIVLPKRNDGITGLLEVYSINGQKIQESTISTLQETYRIDQTIESGNYFVKLSYTKDNIIDYYTGSFIISK